MVGSKTIFTVAVLAMVFLLAVGAQEQQQDSSASSPHHPHQSTEEDRSGSEWSPRSSRGRDRRDRDNSTGAGSRRNRTATSSTGRARPPALRRGSGSQPSTASAGSASTTGNHTGLVAGVIVGSVLVVGIAIALVVRHRAQRRQSSAAEEQPAANRDAQGPASAPYPTPPLMVVQGVAAVDAKNAMVTNPSELCDIPVGAVIVCDETEDSTVDVTIVDDDDEGRH